ncbi:hypothetical protein [Azonexus sp.]|uniref:hypothetical protein n=1 Tax=Azonexus sp. TaxID=1872668 RepID=UPI0035AFA83C
MMIYIVIREVKQMEEADYPAVALVACGLAGIVMSLDVEGKRYGIDRIVAIDTSDRALNAFRNANQKIMIGERAAGKPKTAEQVRKLAGKHQSTIQQALDGMQLVIIVGGAAGFAGGTLATLVAEFAQRNGSLVLALVSWPFPYEPRQRRRQALITLGSLIKHANSVLLTRQIYRAFVV